MLSATGLVRTLARGPLRLQLTPGYVNQVTLVGNVGSITGTAPPTGDKDAEGSEGGEEGKSSKPVRISLAVDRPQSRAALAAKEKKSTQWFNVVIFKPSLQRFALNNFEKGTKVFVSGSLNTSSYIKDNVEKTSVSVIADDITFMSFKKKEEGHEETEDKHKSGVDHL